MAPALRIGLIEESLIFVTAVNISMILFHDDDDDDDDDDDGFNRDDVGGLFWEMVD